MGVGVEDAVTVGEGVEVSVGVVVAVDEGGLAPIRKSHPITEISDCFITVNIIKWK